MAQTSYSSMDLIQLGMAWNTMHGEFHQLVRSIPPEAFRRRTLDTRWTIAEILAHMVQSVDFIPQEIEAVRKGKDFLNFPPPIASAANYLMIKWGARRATPQSLLDSYDRAFEKAMLAWQGIAEEEWSQGVNFFGEGYRTLADNFAVGVAHFHEHAAQIRLSL